ncbi:Epoxide hydrolase A [Linum perenne]
MHIATVGSPTAKSTTLGDYCCIAPDLRGSGDTDAPPSAAKYTAFHIVGDLVGLLDFLGIDKAFVVGHDWGAAMGWYFARFRPDRVRAVVNLSVPPLRQSPVSDIVQAFGAVYGDDYYFIRFQVPKETGFKGLPESVLPWLPEEDVNYYASKFSKTGFTGGLNSYRAISLTGELMGPWVGSKYLVPAKFIVGDQDVVYHMPGMKEYIHSEEFKKDVPMLEEVVIMEGVSHFPNLVKPHEVTQHIFDFIKRF